MPYQQEGFLSQEAQEWMRQNIDRHHELFDHLENVIRSSYDFLGRSKFDNQDKQHVFTSALFLRSLNGLQALYFLSRRGFASDVQAIARSLIEVEFRLGAITHDPLIVNLLVLDQERRRRKKLLNFMSGKIAGPGARLAELQSRKEQFDKDIQRIEQEILRLRPSVQKDKKCEIIIPNIREFAVICGLESSYDLYYDVLCEAVHASTSHLENTTIFDQRNSVQGFNYQLSDDELAMFSLMAVGFHINSIIFTASVLKTNVDEIVVRLRKAHEKKLEAFSEGKM